MGECTRYFVVDEVRAESVPSLKCNHSEADTRVILHMIEADKSTGDIVIRAPDTDILVLLLHHDL